MPKDKSNRMDIICEKRLKILTITESVISNTT